MKTSILFIFLTLCVSTKPSASTNSLGVKDNPGLKILLTRKGLDLVIAKAGNQVNSKLSSIQIPDVDKKIKRGEIKAWNMRVVNYSPMVFSYELEAPNRVTLTATCDEIEIHGEFDVEKKLKFIKLQDDGDFESKATGIQISLTASLHKTTEGKLQFTELSCQPTISDLSIRLDGGILSKIANVFRAKISDHLKPKLESKLCTILTDYIKEKANKKLEKWNPVKSLGGNFSIDYSLMSDPQISYTGVEAYGKGEILYNGQGSNDFYPPPLTSHGVWNTKMVYLWVSDYVLNTFLSHIYKNGQVKKVISSLKTEYLQSTCDNICLGSIIPEIGNRFSNAKIDLIIEAIRAPTAQFRDGAIVIDVDGQLRAVAEDKSDKNTTQLFLADMNLVGELTPIIDIEDQQLRGHLNISRWTAKLKESEIGILSQGFLDNLMGFAKPTLEGRANLKLKERGFPLPVETMEDVELKVLNRTLQVEANVVDRE